MIRITRPAAPASLTTPATQTYLAACAAYAADPTLPKPPKPAGYRSSDLLLAFDTHFYAKCYLTEQRFASAWEMDVDHFEPAHHAPARVFDWTNLFPAAHKANMLRPRSWPPGGLLDPCADDVESDIIYTLAAMGETPGFRALDSANQRAVNTANLLDVLHNGRANDAESHRNTHELRRLIERRYKEVLLAWGHYREACAEGDPLDVAQTEAELKALLSRRASFTMLLRSLPFVRKKLAHLLD